MTTCLTTATSLSGTLLLDNSFFTRQIGSHQHFKISRQTLLFTPRSNASVSISFTLNLISIASMTATLITYILFKGDSVHSLVNEVVHSLSMIQMPSSHWPKMNHFCFAELRNLPGLNLMCLTVSILTFRVSSKILNHLLYNFFIVFNFLCKYLYSIYIARTISLNLFTSAF